jgi:hypothetical protein
MTAPGKIWAGGQAAYYTTYWCATPPIQPELSQEIEYTRADLIPSAAYVAGLETAGKAALNFIENTESEMGIIIGCGDSLRAALSARPDAPDVRVVTVAAALWRAQAVDTGTPQSVVDARIPEAFVDQSEETKRTFTKMAEYAIRAIIGETK